MAFYNKAFDVYDSKFFPNAPFSILLMGHLLFVLTLIWGMISVRKIKEPTENQLEAIRNFNSLYIFGLIMSVPLCFMECKCALLTILPFLSSPNVLVPRDPLHVL